MDQYSLKKRLMPSKRHLGRRYMKPTGAICRRAFEAESFDFVSLHPRAKRSGFLPSNSIMIGSPNHSGLLCPLHRKDIEVSLDQFSTWSTGGFTRDAGLSHEMNIGGQEGLERLLHRDL